MPILDDVFNKLAIPFDENGEIIRGNRVDIERTFDFLSICFDNPVSRKEKSGFRTSYHWFLKQRDTICISICCLCRDEFRFDEFIIPADSYWDYLSAVCFYEILCILPVLEYMLS